MRNLILGDAGKASKIIKKLKLRADKELDTSSLDVIGASLVLKIVENYSDVEGDVADFMAGLLEDEGMTKENFLKLELSEAIAYFEKVQRDPGFGNFTKFVRNLSGGK